MDFTFYYSPMSSAVPVACALAELEVPHRRVTLDLAKQEQRSADFLKINPNGKVPTLVVDGTPMFEAVAILQYLGAAFGVDKDLWPALGTPERLTAHVWAAWTYVTFGSTVRQLFLASHERAPAELKSQAWANHARVECQKLLGVLDGQLAKTGYITGDHYSLADLTAGCAVLWASTAVGVPTADHPHVGKWLQTLSSRPAIKQEFGL